MTGLMKVLLSAVTALAVLVCVLQSSSIRKMRSDLASLRGRLDAPDPGQGSLALNPTRLSESAAGPAELRIEQRLADLERAVSKLTGSANYLMERGELPQSEEKAEELYGRLADAAASDQERLRALRMLGRNGKLTEEAAAQAAAWLGASTNVATQRAILQALDDHTNAALKNPLLGMAAAGDARVRREAADALSGFSKDPQVEKQLWDLVANDPNKDVREEAERALRDEAPSAARMADLQQRVGNPQASVSERLAAFRLLERAKADTSDAAAALAQLALDTTDPALLRDIFRAFDRTQDPTVKLPLVYGLQDPNPLVREEAVEALASFRSDPVVSEWLRFVSENDADPKVRREAFQVMIHED